MDNLVLKIQLLKKELNGLILSHKQKDPLNAQRDDLERLILALEEEMDLLITKSLSIGEEPDLPQKQTLLREVKIKLRELDHLLDECENANEETIQDLETKLAALIIEKYPDEKYVYEDLIKELNEIKDSQQDLKELIKTYEHLLELMQNIVEINTKVNKRGILSYIFGRSPIGQMSQHLGALGKVAQHQFEILKEKQKYEEALVILSELTLVSKETWNFKKIDRFLKSYQTKLSSMHVSFNTELQKYQEREREVQQEIRGWIEKFSG